MPDIQLPTTGVFSGQAEQGFINAALRQIVTMFAGTVEPTTGNTKLNTLAGLWWHHTGFNIIYLRDKLDLNWIPIFFLDEAGGYSGTAINAGSWITVSGTANAIVLTIPGFPTIPFVRGFKIGFQATATNSGALTVNGVAVFKKTSAGIGPCTGGEVHIQDLVELESDGTHWQLMSDVPAPIITGLNNTFSGNNTFTGNNDHTTGIESFERISVKQGYATGAPLPADAVAGVVSMNLLLGSHFNANCNNAAVTIANPLNQKAGQSGACLLYNLPAGATITMGSNWHSAYGVRLPASGGNDFLVWYCYAPGYILFSLAQNAS
jgi:hypothetical protein